LAAPLPLPPDGAAVLGIGRPRHGLVPAGVEGARAAGVGTQCVLTLTYDPRRIQLERANAFVAPMLLYRPWDRSDRRILTIRYVYVWRDATVSKRSYASVESTVM